MNLNINMKKQLILITFFAFIALNTFCQQTDTIFYDKEFKECKKDMSFYYGFKYLDSEFTGIEKYYYNNNQMHSLKNIKTGHEHGSVTWWYKNGKKWCDGNFQNGIKHGAWIFYHENGQKSTEGYYNLGKKGKEYKKWDENGNELVDYLVVDKKPLFGGKKNYKKSEKALNKYIAKNAEYPEIAIKNDLETKVQIKFIIDEKGKVCNIEVTKKGNYILEQKAIEIIESLPDWKPAEHNGKKVRVPFGIPINFKLK